jgi:putative spermidine/putrescine transport system permease protein
MSSLLRGTGRDVEDMGEETAEAVADLDPAWEEPATWVALWPIPPGPRPRPPGLPPARRVLSPPSRSTRPRPRPCPAPPRLTPTSRTSSQGKEDSPAEEEPWPFVLVSLADDLRANPDAPAAFEGEARGRLRRSRPPSRREPSLRWTT